MSWKEFDIAGIDKGFGLSFEISADLSKIDHTDWFIVPAGVRSLTVTVTPSNGASAIVQTTTDLVNNIKDDDFEVSYTDWVAGEVSNIYCDVTNNRVNAIRCVQLSEGNVRFTVVC